MRFALGLSYDGSSFQGWQKQPGGQTVQDAVESALSSFVSEPVATVCAGRTDTGVHALEQIVHFDTSAERSPESWIRGVNALLPDTIALQWAKPVPDDFHARFSAIGRTYVYILRNVRVRSPFLTHHAGWTHRPLDLGLMRDAAKRLLGEHDFSSFRSSQCQAPNPIRTIIMLDIEERQPFFVFTFRANAFLHHMVRNIMGALIYVGMGRHAPEWIDYLLVQRDRRLSAPTFSPRGLYLATVDYPAHFGLPLNTWDETLYQLTGFKMESSVPPCSNTGIY